MVNLSDVIGAIPIVGIGLVGLVNWISAWKLLTMPYYITKPIVLLGLILYLVTKVRVGIIIFFAWRHIVDSQRQPLVFGRHGRFFVDPTDVYLGFQSHARTAADYAGWDRCVCVGCRLDPSFG